MVYNHVSPKINRGVGMENHGVTTEVLAMDFNRAGEGSSKIKKTLQLIGVRPDILRRISIISYEAEMNLVIHSHGGEISCLIYPDKVEIIAKDNGPGIVNIDLAMEEGYSTATDAIREMGFGAGLGLPNIKRCSDEFSISSKLESGTTLISTVYL